MSKGVYYREQDYAGVWRRLLTDLIDIPVLLLLIAIAGITLDTLFPYRVAAAALLPVAAILAFLYLALLKRSRLRTLGYRVAGVRIVDFHGDTPSATAVTLRLIFAVFGPLNILLDLFWIPGDPCRQALRDKFAQTYVVRERAKPAGSAPIRLCRYGVLGWSFVFQEVAPEAQAPPATKG